MKLSVDSDAIGNGKKLNCIYKNCGTKSPQSSTSTRIKKIAEAAEAAADHRTTTVEAEEPERVQRNILYFDSESSDSGRRSSKSDQRHRTVVLEALVKLRVAVQQNLCRLTDGGKYDSIPTKDKRRLYAAFVDISNCVDECMNCVTARSRNASEPSKITYGNVYADLYRLEAKFNEVLQDFIDIVTDVKNNHETQSKNSGWHSCCKNLVSCWFRWKNAVKGQ